MKHPSLIIAATLCGCLATTSFAHAQQQQQQSNGNATDANKAAGEYDALYERYLTSARSMNAGSPTAAYNWMANLSADRRARGVNDLITIHVIENLQASGTADAALNKSSSASAGVGKMFGLETKLPSSV